jgi:hypothetical protein
MRMANSVFGMTDLFNVIINFQDSGVGMHVGSPIPRNPLDVKQKAMLPLDGPHVTSMS